MYSVINKVSYGLHFSRPNAVHNNYELNDSFELINSFRCERNGIKL